MKDLWYRAEVKRYSSIDEWGDVVGSYTQIVWSTYEVERYTPRGVIFKGWGFMRGVAKRQLALPTKELALRDCEIRKEHHIRGCQNRLRAAEYDMEVIKREQSRLRSSDRREPL